MDTSISCLIIKVALILYVLLVLVMNKGASTTPIVRFIESPPFTIGYVIMVIVIAIFYDKVVAILLMIVLCIWIQEYVDRPPNTHQHFTSSQSNIDQKSIGNKTRHTDVNGIFRLPKPEIDPKPSGSFDLIQYETLYE